MTETEQQHIVEAFAFELGKCQFEAVRARMLGRLEHVDAELAKGVAELLGMEGKAEKVEVAVPAKPVEPSPSLSQLNKALKTIEGRKVAMLVSDGTSSAFVESTRTRLQKEGAKLELVGPKVSGVQASEGTPLKVDHAVVGAPSVLFDAVILAPSSAGIQQLLKKPETLDFVRDAFVHLKVIGYTPDAQPLLQAARVQPDADAGLVALSHEQPLDTFVDTAKRQRIWSRVVASA
jgi:catalase